MSKKFAALQLSQLCSKSEYDYENKKAYHAMGRMILKRLADTMRLQKGEFTVRSCEGGIAVPGEIILHSDHLYIMIRPSPTSPGASIMYRTCKGQKDYFGGNNCGCSIKELDDLEAFADKMLAHIERYGAVAA